jgi:hypothetical protein
LKISCLEFILFNGRLERNFSKRRSCVVFTVPEKIDTDELVEAAGTRARISSLVEPPGAGNDPLGVLPFYHC